MPSSDSLDMVLGVVNYFQGDPGYSHEVSDSLL